MKKHLYKLIFIPCIFILTACPYYSDFGLSDPQKSSIDTLLTGSWYTLSEENSDTAELDILQFNDYEIYLEFKITEKNKLITQRYRGYNTSINDQKIINLKRLDIDQRYIFLKYTIKDRNLEMSYASDEFITKTLSTEKELYNFFENNITKPELFEEQMKFTRKN